MNGETFIPKRYNNLYAQITSKENLKLAFEKAAAGKKKSFSYLEFKEFSNLNLYNLQQQLINHTYRLGPYRQFYVFEPKARLISALDFRDRVVQHALCNIITPIFEKSFLPYNFACRAGLGTHAGVKYVQASLRKHDYKYFLKTDFSKFFPSINRQTLFSLIKRKIKCKETLALIELIAPPDGIGLPIGNLTSQLFANVYGSVCDRYIHDVLKQPNWARYMDDIVVLGNDPEELLNIFNKFKDISYSQLGLKISKWSIAPTTKGINFLGYRIWKNHKLLRKSSVLKAKRKLRRFKKVKDLEGLQRFKASFNGHCILADGHNLRKHLELT